MRLYTAVLLLFVVGCSDNIVISDYSAPPPAVTPPSTQWRPPPRDLGVKYDTTWAEGPQGFVGIGIEHRDLLRPHNYTMVTDTLFHPIRAGWKSERFELVRGDCYTTDCDRQPPFERVEYAEVTGDSIGNPISGEGTEFWYGWSFFVPSHVNGISNNFFWNFIGQFQQSPSAQPAWVFFKSSGDGLRPLCLMRFIVTTQYWQCDGPGRYPIVPNDDFMNRWHDIIINARWTASEDGFLKLWLNGDLIVDYVGVTTSSGNTSVYFKYGLYRMRPPIGVFNDTEVRNVVYFDEVRKGLSRDEVDIRRLLSQTP
jgi:hypothetical protein